MTAPERLPVPFAGLRERPRSCPEHVWQAFDEMRATRRPWSWFWYQCALAEFDRDGFRGLHNRPEPLEPTEASDPSARARYEAAVRGNAERFLDVERFRIALQDHDPNGEALAACRRAADTYRGWGPHEAARAPFNADLRAIQRRDPCRHGFEVRWSGDECPEGCR